MEREMAELKLVLHVDQADHWPAAFGNLNNLTRDYPDAEIRSSTTARVFMPSSARAICAKSSTSLPPTA
jgi:intracellular sulfur oxidation DsrE/DsrF family protein